MQAKETVFSVLAGAVLLAGTTAMAPALEAQGPPPPPPGYYQQGPPQPWEAPPSEYAQDIQRKGFHDGIEGARRDYGNHRRPDVNNRDEYRHPNVPREVRHDYREAFRRGYQVGVEHIMHGGY